MTQKERIIKRLLDAGKVGLPTAELFDGLFCCNYKARISDLRRDGWNILAVRIGGASVQWRYFILSSPEGSPLVTEDEAKVATAKMGSLWSIHKDFTFNLAGQGELIPGAGK